MCSLFCMFITVILSGFFVLLTISQKEQVKFEAYPARIRFWNRDLSYATKTRSSNIVNWRKPNIHLSPDEYMMGTELSKGNHCHHFVIDDEASRKEFCRCTHFFRNWNKNTINNIYKRQKLSLAIFAEFVKNFKIEI